MRFVSHVRKFGLGVVTERSHPTQYGDVIIDRPGYIAWFSADLVNQADVEWAEREFEDAGLISGRTTMLDEVTLTPLRNRLSVFDTDEAALREGWTPEFKQMVEEVMSRRAVGHTDFRQVLIEPVEAPWPRYLDFNGSLEELIAKIVEDGYDPRRVLAYERQSGHRPMVEAELEKLVTEFEQVEALAPEVPV